jgi:hypothetical protein
MNKKFLLPIVIVAILVVVVGIYFTTRGPKGPTPTISGPEETPSVGEVPRTGEIPSAEEGTTVEDCIRVIETVPIEQRYPSAYFGCAVGYKNPQVCEKMKLLANVDPELSKQVKDACYMNYAGSTKDISVCDKISSEEEKRSCIELVQSIP